MSDLRSETEKAAEKTHGAFFSRTGVYLEGALNGPPLLRALKALKCLESIWLAHGCEKSVATCKICAIRDQVGSEKALLEIEAARGSGEK